MTNILHIFVDQMRADAVAALGNPVIRTPTLDRLCAEGTAFTRAYSPCPVCVAARCSMIFGQYAHHTGCSNNGVMPTDGRETFMAALTRAGYRTHGIGKCHFTPDRLDLRGFQTREIQEEGIGSGDDYHRYLEQNGLTWFLEAHGVRGEMYYVPQPSQLPAEHHATQWVGDRSLAFLETTSGDKPWYLYTSFVHPHPPFAPPSPWHKLYRGPLMPLPNMPADGKTLHTYINRIQNRYKYRDQGLDTNLLRCMKAYYYGCISFVDYQIGRLMESLAKSGQLENTLVLFASDHGEYLGDYGCFGKRGMHDAAARVPLIVRQPGEFPQGETCQTPASLVDIAPTFLQAAGATLETHGLDGLPLQRVAGGITDRRVISQHTPNVGFMKQTSGTAYLEQFDSESLSAATSEYMIADERWKYVYSSADRTEFLFDSHEDPKETRNRAGIPFTTERVDEMRMDLMRRVGETGERWRTFPQPPFPTNPDAGLLIQDMYVPWADPQIPGYTDS